MTIDMHSHWVPPELADILRGRTDAPSITVDESGKEFLRQPRGSFPLPNDYGSSGGGQKSSAGGQQRSGGGGGGLGDSRAAPMDLDDDIPF